MGHVLLVEDDNDNLELFRAILEDCKHSVEPYSDSVKALMKFKPNYYDLIILDYYMESLDGLSLCRKIRDIDKSVKVILLTASVEELGFLSDELNFKIIRIPVTIKELLLQVRFMVNATQQNPEASQFISNFLLL